ncbi:hypothetical protein Brsp01_14070 [Brucella sp. NBRC 12950]|nr:hypothetical protein Brsp01_14070 [Brucella sp. NBRC 12950]
MVPTNPLTDRRRYNGAASMFRKYANFGEERRSVLISILALLLGSFLLANEKARAGEALRSDRVDAAVVFAVDRSSLPDIDDVQMVREGHIAALRSLYHVMTSGPNQCVAIAYIEWLDDSQSETVLPWRRICDEGDAEAAATAIALYRPDDHKGEAGSMLMAINAALDEVKMATWSANRLIVNLSIFDDKPVGVAHTNADTTNIITVQKDCLHNQGSGRHLQVASSTDYLAAIERSLMFDVGGDRAFYMKAEEPDIRTAKTDIIP